VRVHPSEADALQQGISPERYKEVFWRDAFDHTQIPAGFDTISGIRGMDPSGLLEVGVRIDLGGPELEVIHTSGHSPRVFRFSIGGHAPFSAGTSCT